MKESIGSVAEEAAKLFAVLQQAADTRTPPPDDVRPPEQDDVPGPERDEEPEHEVPEHEHKLGPDCMWCPMCQLINKVRHTSPETIEQLSTAAAHVLGSVRSLLEAAAEAARQAREDAASRSDQQEEPSRSPVDRIDVSEDPEPWD
jgi:hypothetical protein